MAQAKGSKAQFMIDFETTYGSDPDVAAGILLPINTSGLQATRNTTEPKTLVANRQPVEPIQGNFDVKGAVVVPVDEIAMGYWLLALLGSSGYSVSGVGDPYTHVFTIGDHLESMVVEHGFTDLGRYHKFNGVKAAKMSISFGGDGELTASLDLVGAQETPAGSSYDGSPTSLTFKRFGNFQCTLEEGGSSIAYVKKLDLNISNNLDEDEFVIGDGGIRGSLPEGMVAISGTLTAQFINSTLYAKATGNTESSLLIVLTSGTHSLTIEMPEIKYGVAGPTVEGPGGISVVLPFYAYYSDDVGAEALTATLVNEYEAYGPLVSESASPSLSPSISPSVSPSISPSLSPSISPSISPSVSPSS